MKSKIFVSLALATLVATLSGCGSEEETAQPSEHLTTEVKRYRSGAIVIKDNTTYSNVSGRLESFNTPPVMQNDDLGPEDVRFGPNSE